MSTESKDFRVRQATSWAVVELRDLGEFKNGVNAGAEDFGRGIPFVNLMDVFGKSEVHDLDYALVDIPAKAAAEYALAKGDVLFVRSSVKPEGVGLAAVLLKDLPLTVYSGFLIRFRPNGNLHPAFAKYCFAEPGFRKSLLARSTISANTNINQQALSTLSVPLPSLAEQRAIVEVLDAAEAAVRAADALIERKIAYKKALAEDLLTGRRRFPGFPSPWRETKLSRFFAPKDDRAPTKTPLILSCSKVYGILPQSERFSKQLASVSNAHYKHIVPGDLVYDPMLLWDASIAFSEYEGIVSPAYETLSWIGDEHGDRRFFKALFKSDTMRCVYTTISQGTNARRRKAPVTDFLKVSLKMPEAEEQRRIADLLSALDEEILLLRKQRNALNEQKTGLMQKLLTGEVRLKEFRQ